VPEPTWPTEKLRECIFEISKYLITAL